MHTLYNRTYPIYTNAYTYTHTQTHIYTHTYKQNYTLTHISTHIIICTFTSKPTIMDNYKYFSHTRAHIRADNTYVHVIKYIHIPVKHTHLYMNT
jgi:hypothetical protein